MFKSVKSLVGVLADAAGVLIGAVRAVNLLVAENDLWKKEKDW